MTGIVYARDVDTGAQRSISSTSSSVTTSPRAARISRAGTRPAEDRREYRRRESRQSSPAPRVRRRCAAIPRAAAIARLSRSGRSRAWLRSRRRCARERHRVDVPGEIGGVGPPAGSRHRRVDQHDAGQTRMDGCAPREWRCALPSNGRRWSNAARPSALAKRSHPRPAHPGCSRGRPELPTGRVHEYRGYRRRTRGPKRSPTKPHVIAGLVMPGSTMIGSRSGRGAAVAQVMLADAIGMDVGAVQKIAHCGLLRCQTLAIGSVGAGQQRARARHDRIEVQRFEHGVGGGDCRGNDRLASHRLDLRNRRQRRHLHAG